ncbi:MAG: DUF2332 family protein [Roseobacter sp.]|nr:DUF2332 family protein [Roseobacter sp.]
MSLAEAFADQSASCTRLGSPFMGRLFAILARDWTTNSALDRYFASFTGDIGPAGASLPLRIAGGLHALVLSGRAAALAATYPPHDVSDAQLGMAIHDALKKHEAFLLEWVGSAPQTNEVRRSAALMAGAAVVKTLSDLPVWLSELGASGGLNLMWDHFALHLPRARLGAQPAVLTLAPEWHGPLPPLELPEIAARGAVDLNPLDPREPSDLLRMSAFLWPDQPERLALTQAAASVIDTPVTRGDAIAWLSDRIATAPEGHIHLIQHTVAWQYFPPSRQTEGRRMIEAAGAACDANRPIAWLSMETDGDKEGSVGAALTLRFWPGDVTLHLGRADFHGRWIKWAGA